MEMPIINILEKALAEMGKEHFDEIIYMIADGQLYRQNTNREIMLEDLQEELENVDNFRKSRLLTAMYESIMAIDQEKFTAEFANLDFAAFICLLRLFSDSQAENIINRLYNVIDQQHKGQKGKRRSNPADNAKLLYDINKSFDERAIRRGEISREELEQAENQVRQESQTLVEMAKLAQAKGATESESIKAVLDYLFEQGGIDPNSQQAKDYLRFIFDNESGEFDNGNDERRD